MSKYYKFECEFYHKEHRLPNAKELARYILFGGVKWF